jgi:hypothetical protein
MFVRWQHRKKTRPMFFGRGRTHDGGDVRWTAILAESVRIDGKPRQRHIAYLGGYYENDGIGDREEFWKTVTAHLDRLGLSPAERKKIEADIARKIPRPTKRQLADAERRANKLRATFADKIGSKLR